MEEKSPASNKMITPRDSTSSNYNSYEPTFGAQLPQKPFEKECQSPSPSPHPSFGNDYQSTKSSKSPKAPKRAYTLFFEKYKAEFFDKYPTSSRADYVKFISAHWKSYDAEQKQVWYTLEEHSRQDFFNDARNSLPHEENIPSSAMSVASDTDSLIDERKFSKVAFAMFVQVMRDQVLLEYPSFTYNEIQKELSKVWKSLSREEKQVWAALEAASIPPPMMSKKRGPVDGLPRPPRSAYNLFYQCARKQLSAEYPDITSREFPPICSRLWRNMPDEERALWLADAARDKERYEREMQTYIDAGDCERSSPAQFFLSDPIMQIKRPDVGSESLSLNRDFSLPMQVSRDSPVGITENKSLIFPTVKDRPSLFSRNYSSAVALPDPPKNKSIRRRPRSQTRQRAVRPSPFRPNAVIADDSFRSHSPEPPPLPPIPQSEMQIVGDRSRSGSIDGLDPLLSPVRSTECLQNVIERPEAESDGMLFGDLTISQSVFDDDHTYDPFSCSIMSHLFNGSSSSSSSNKSGIESSKLYFPDEIFSNDSSLFN